MGLKEHQINEIIIDDRHV